MNYKSSILILCILALAVSAYGQAEFVEKDKNGYPVCGMFLSQEGEHGKGIALAAVSKGIIQIGGSYIKYDELNTASADVALHLTRLGGNESPLGIVIFAGFSGSDAGGGTLLQFGMGGYVPIIVNKRLKFSPYVSMARISDVSDIGGNSITGLGVGLSAYDGLSDRMGLLLDFKYENASNEGISIDGTVLTAGILFQTN